MALKWVFSHLLDPCEQLESKNHFSVTYLPKSQKKETKEETWRQSFKMFREHKKLGHSYKFGSFELEKSKIF